MLEGEKWRCRQCGQHYYPITGSLDQRAAPTNPGLAAAIGEIMPSQGNARVRCSPWNLNSLIVSRNRSDSRWWERNRDVVKYLD